MNVDPLTPGFIQEVSQVEVVAVTDEDKALAHRALSAVRGYARADLIAMAEIGYHYLMSGAPEFAHVIFDGLVAIAPQEPYFALSLGLTHDHLGELKAAARCYARASKLDPTDGRPDVNRAELHIEVRDFDRAKKLLRSGLRKAVAAEDDRLAIKAKALLDHVSRPRSKSSRRVA